MLLVLVISVLCVSAEEFDSKLSTNFSSFISSVIADNEIGTDETSSVDSPVNTTFAPLFYPASSLAEESPGEGRSFQPSSPKPKTFSPRFQKALENVRRRQTSIASKPQRKFFLPLLATGPNHGYSGSYPSNNLKGYGPPKAPPVSYYPPPSPPRPAYYPPHRPPSSGYGAPKPASAYKPTYGAPVKPYYPAPNPVSSYPSYPSGPSYSEKPTHPAIPSYPSYPSYTEKPSYPSGPVYSETPTYPLTPTYPSVPSYPSTTPYPATVGYPAVPSYPITPKPIAPISYPGTGYQPQTPGYPSGYPGSYPASNYQPHYPPASHYPSHPKPGYNRPNPGHPFWGYFAPKPVHVYPPSNYGFNKPSLPPGVYPPAKPSSGYGVPKAPAISYSSSYSATKEYGSSAIEAQSYSASEVQNPSYKTGNFEENQLSSYGTTSNYSPYVGTATEAYQFTYPSTTPRPVPTSYQSTFTNPSTSPSYSSSATTFAYPIDSPSTPPPNYNPPAILLSPSSGNSLGFGSSSVQSNPPKWSRPISSEFFRTSEQPQLFVQFGSAASNGSLDSPDRFNRQLQPKCNTSHEETTTPQPSQLFQAVVPLPLPSTNHFVFPPFNEVTTENNVPRHFGHTNHQQHRPNDCGGPWVLLDSPFGYSHVNVEPIRPQNNPLPSFAGSSFRGLQSQPDFNLDGFGSNSFPIDVRDKTRFEARPSLPAATTPSSSSIGASIFVRDNANPTTVAPASSTDNSIVFSNVKPPSLSDVLNEQDSHPSPFLFTRGRPGMDDLNRTSEDSPKKSKTVIFASNQVTPDNALQKNSIVQQLARINLRALSALVQRAGIAPILDDEEELTIFAPSNIAFGDVAPEVRNQWENDIDSLREILLYHVVPGKLVTNILRNEETPLTYAGSHRLRINIYNSTDVKRIITVNGARLVTSDIRIGNALIHVIDRVLQPIPQQTIMDIINNGGMLNSLQSAILGPHLTNVLLTPTPLTVFVPTTEAFLSLSEEERELFQNDTAFHDIIWYHAIPGSFYSEGLQDGQWITSLRGPGAIQVQVLNDGRRNRLVSVNGVANVIRSDVSATNGVIHFIDRILTNIIPDPTN